MCLQQNMTFLVHYQQQEVSYVKVATFFGWNIYCNQSWFWFFASGLPFQGHPITESLSKHPENAWIVLWKPHTTLTIYYLYCLLFSTTLHNIIIFVMVYLVRNLTAVSLMFRLDSLVFKESFITSSEKMFVIYCLRQSIMLKQIIK